MPLDPQVKSFLEQQAAAGPPPVLAHERRDARRAQSVMAVEDRKIPGPQGEIPLRIYTPPGQRPLPILVYYHGGGWVTGDLDTHDFICRMLARWAVCVVVHVNYRHAPEHPFPAAVDDAYAGACWVANNVGALDGDPARIAVGGDSAGANLAAAVTLLSREHHFPHLAFQYLAYPPLDFALETESMTINGSGYGLTADACRWFRGQYVPNEADWANPLASPLLASDHSELPRALILTAEFDPLRDDGEAYAVRLRDSGVSVQLIRYEGLVHGFFAQMAEVDAARVAMGDVTAALRSVFADSPATITTSSAR